MNSENLAGLGLIISGLPQHPFNHAFSMISTAS